MTEVKLAYGDDYFSFSYKDDRFSVLTNNTISKRPLNDADIGQHFDDPIASRPLDEIVETGDSILIVASDATRATASAQIINLLIRRLIQAGVAPPDIAIIFATGIHRSVTNEEKSQLLTPFIAQRIRTLDHDPTGTTSLLNLGETPRGVPVEVNSSLREFSHVILTGAIGFHYFAGFTGGRKSVCPGLASAKTIEATHMLALDFEHGGRKAGVGPGLLDGNPVHEECERVAQLIAPSFSINAVVDERKRAVKLFCGDWRIAHRAGCKDYLANHSVNIHAKRDVVIVSCGGAPHDINLIQAHKALDMAAQACNDGGSIILLAECRDGFGRSDFLKWFEEIDSRSLEMRLREGYEVNGQTAWSLMTKAERFRVFVVSELPSESVKRMRMIPCGSLSEALGHLPKSAEGFVLPRGAAVLPRVMS